MSGGGGGENRGGNSACLAVLVRVAHHEELADQLVRVRDGLALLPAALQEVLDVHGADARDLVQVAREHLGHEIALGGRGEKMRRKGGLE